MTDLKRRLLGASLAASVTAAGLALVAPAPTASASGVSPVEPKGYLAPAYVTGDLTGDHQITTADLDLVRAALGRTSTSAGWSGVAAADLDEDGRLTIGDLAALAQKVIYDDGSFELVEASVLDMQKALNAGVVTSVQLTQDYLDRIAAYDRTKVDPAESGRPLNSIITTSSAALEAAAASDAARERNGGPSGMLDGIPVLLKDNYDTKDMPTSAGCSCWEDNQTADDAAMVAGLRKAGAIILGKASLDEFAYGFTSQFSAGSPVGSSRYVASPYNTAQTAGGSSGGTGASIAANLGALGFGTDTGGSIRVPSSYNQLVGLRPTVGLASRDGIVPLALSQDTGGPMGRSVSDVAIALDAVVGSDPADPVTAGADAHVPDSYTRYLQPGSLTGKRFAYLTSMLPPADTSNAGQKAARRIFLDAVAELQAAGATVTAIDPATDLAADPDTGITAAKILGEGSGSTNEFKHDLNAYIEHHLDPDVTIRSIADMVTSGKYTPAYKNTYNSRDAISQSTYDAWIGTPDEPGTHAKVLRDGRAYVTSLMDDRDLDALIYPSGTPYGTYSTNLRLSPNTGLPALTVPMGQTTDAETLPGAGVNLEFLGRAYDEGDLLAMGYAYEQATHHRTAAALYPALDGEAYQGPGVDTDEPGDGSVTVTGAGRSLKTGQTFTVTVDQSATGLYAYELGLGFDPRALRLVSSAAADTTGHGSVTARGSSISVVQTKLGSSPAAKGATRLARLTFEALKPGTAKVSVDRLVTVDGSGRSTVVRTPGAAAVSVAKHATSVSVRVPSREVRAGGRVKVTVSVAALGRYATAPTGRLRVQVGEAVLRQRPAVVGGTATFVLRAPRIGWGHVRKTVRVTFLPTAELAGSSGEAILRVRRR